jgi:23S rRNA (uracil1939-C5)-methyltransferase
MKVDVMFFDPPRTGLGDETIDQILKFRPKRLVYGSCNPSTLAKDINRLLENYELAEITPIDMFPFTSLVESVSLLVLKSS